MKLSVHIVTDGRTELFKNCYLSVIQALPDDAEVCVVVNGTHPEAVEYLETVKDPRVRWLTISRCSISAARNLGFSFCRGEIIHFLDDDVTVAPGFFDAVLRIFRNDPGLAIVGGPNLTPPQSGSLERAFGAIMANPFAAPKVNHRYRAEGNALRADETHLIFCNLAVRTELIPTTLRFCERLKANEENYFIYQSRKEHLQALWSPEVWVYHRRRATLYSFFKQVRHYGSGRGQQTGRAPTSSSALFLVPPVACLVGAYLLFFFPVLLLGLVFLHALMALGSAVRMSESSRAGTPILAFAPLALLVHLAYGTGFWLGLAREAKAGFRIWLHQKLNPLKVGASLRSISRLKEAV